MKYLADTDHVADYLNQRSAAKAILDPLLPDGVALSILTHSEVHAGILGSRDPKAAERVFRAFMRGVTILGINQRVSRTNARIRRDLRARKLPVDNRSIDLLIAATAITYDLTLLTRNVRDYRDIGGLKIHPMK